MNASKKDKLLNLPNSSSFLKPPKVFLKKSSSNLVSGLKSFCLIYTKTLFLLAFGKVCLLALNLGLKI